MQGPSCLAWPGAARTHDPILGRTEQAWEGTRPLWPPSETASTRLALILQRRQGAYVDSVTLLLKSVGCTVPHLCLGSGPWGLIPESRKDFLGRVFFRKNQHPGAGGRGGVLSLRTSEDTDAILLPVSTVTGIRRLKTKVALRSPSQREAGNLRGGVGRRLRDPDTSLLSTDYILVCMKS